MTAPPLADRTVLVTGAAHGIGEATARLLADRGAQVVVADVDRVAGERVVDELGPGARFACLDVTDEAAWARVAAELGGVDVLVHSAGIAVRAELAGSELAQFRHVVEVNLVGTYLALRTAAGLVRDGGSVVTLSSVRGVLATAGLGAYGATKSGVRALTRVAALELAHRGVRCNSVCPGSIATGITERGGFDDADTDTYLRTIPAQRQGSPEEVARAIAFLAGDESSYVTGTDLLVDGGTAAGATIPRREHEQRPPDHRADGPDASTTR